MGFPSLTLQFLSQNNVLIVSRRRFLPICYLLVQYHLFFKHTCNVLVLQECLQKQQEENDKERSRLQELLAKMEVQIREQERQLHQVINRFIARPSHMQFEHMTAGNNVEYLSEEDDFIWVHGSTFRYSQRCQTTCMLS